VFYALVIALYALEAFGLSPLRATHKLRTRSQSPRRPFFAIGLCALPIAFALHMWLLGEIYRAQPLAYQTTLPFPVIDEPSAPLILSRSCFAAALFLVALSETAALWIVIRALDAERSKIVDGVLVGIAAAALAAIAFRVPALGSADMYAYVSDGLLGREAYTPPGFPLSGEYAAINAWWGTPIRPTPYGPLWVAFNAWLLHFADTLPGKIRLLQATGLACILALASLLRACNLRRATCALVLLNPFLYLQFVSNGHNDLWPVLLTVAAFAIARRRSYAALPFAIAAGAMKIPFAAIGALAFAGTGSAIQRISLAALSAIGGVAISLAFAGRGFVNGLHFQAAAGDLTSGLALLRNPEHAVAGALAIAAICAALLGRRVPRFAVLTLPALAVKLYPWYAIWCLPFVLDDEALLTRLLVALPVLSFLLESIVDVRWYLFGAFATIVAGALPRIVRKMRRRSGRLAAEYGDPG
jgi:hypothetical protein